MTDLIKKVVDGDATEEEYSRYFTEKDSELSTKYSNLVYGTRTKIGDNYRRVGYEILREFFDGDQWQYKPEGGKQTKVYNHVRGVVVNYTAFMTNEPIDIDVPPLEITDEIEVARSEEKEKFLLDVLEDNNFSSQFEASVQNGSLLGDSIITGPFYDDDDERIWFQNIKEPENVRIIWADDSYSTIIGYIHHYWVSEELAYKMFPEAKERDIVFTTDTKAEAGYLGSSAKTGRLGPASSTTDTIKMVHIMDCWTDRVHQLIVGSKSLEFDLRDPDFVPIVYVPNMIHPTESGGISDIEDLLDTQVEINEKNSDMSEVISQTAYPVVWGKNLDPVEVQSDSMNLVDIGDEGEIIADPRRGQSGNLSNEISRRMSSIFQLSGLNENVFGGAGVRAVTGRALSVLMQTVNNRIKGRQTRWSRSLQELFENIFILAEQHSKDAKELIGGYYKTDIFFPGTLLRNTTDEINKFNAKLQSQSTTMKNLGVPSPADEQKLMKKEMADKILMVETSRNPGLQLQVHQMLQQELAKEVGGNKPQLREDENSGEEEPMAGGGAPSATSVEGAVQQNNQQTGGAVVKEGSEE